jgi:hypothetical protein
MRHYSLEQWADFARNVAGTQERLEMQQHLDQGCNKCAKVASLWRHVHAVAKHEHRYAPPDGAVRMAKGNFAIHGPRGFSRRPSLIASLIFDSSLGPLPAGVRSAARVERQLLYGVGNYRIDLRIEPQVDTDNVAIVGQVLRSSDTISDIGPVTVKLTKGRKVVAQTESNKFGEFRLECDLSTGFQLRISLPVEELCVQLIEPGGTNSEKNDSKRLS